MMPFLAGNEFLALAAALVWGAGDFSGGMGVKAAGGSLRAALRIILISHASSLVVLIAIAMLRGDPFPHGVYLYWGLTAGVAGGISLACFYIALSRGAMGASAAVSGLLAAAIPAFVASFTEGPPGAIRLAGFVIAGGSIWMIAAGSGFGIYFVALKMAGPAGVFWPMANARMGSLTLCTIATLALGSGRRQGVASIAHITPRAVRWALSTALLDTSGNLLFVEATRAGRLDVAAVLASLYPASTILLAAWMLHERPTRRQALGMAIAVLAVALISLG